MGDSTIEGQFGADPNSNDHEAQLVVKAVAQYFAQIIFDYCKENREKGHHDANADERLCTRESPGQRVDCEFGCKRTQKYCAGYRGLRVSVL